MFYNIEARLLRSSLIVLFPSLFNKTSFQVIWVYPYVNQKEVNSICFWPGLGLPSPKAILVIPKLQLLPNHLRKKRVKCEVPLATTLQKRPVIITMYLGLDILISLSLQQILIDVRY